MDTESLLQDLSNSVKNGLLFMQDPISKVCGSSPALFLCVSPSHHLPSVSLYFLSLSHTHTTSKSLSLSLTHTHLQQWQKHFFVLVKTGKLMFTEQQEREEIDVEKDDEPEVVCDL